MTNEHGWTVTFEAAGEPGSVEDDALGRLLDGLVDFSGSVSAAQDGSRYGATFSIDAARIPGGGLFDALDLGRHLFVRCAERAGLPEWPVVRAEVMTFAEQDAELARPLIPELVGVSEIADALGVSRQRAHQLTKRPDFPAPVAEPKSGPIWTRPSLNLFIERWRGDKPDMSAELAAVDEVLDELRAMRNRLAHGDIDERLPTILASLAIAKEAGDQAANLLQQAMLVGAGSTGTEVAKALQDALARADARVGEGFADELARAAAADFDVSPRV